MLRRIGVRAAEHVQPVGVRAEGHPDLLAVQHPLVAVADGPGPHAAEIGARLRLAEPLPPHLVAGHDAGKEARLLGRRPGVEERGPEQVAPVHADPVRRPGAEVFLEEHELLFQGPAAAAVLDRPRETEPATGGQLALPREAQLPPGVVGGTADAPVAGELAGEVLGQPVPDLLATGRLGRRVDEVHQVSVRWCGARGLPL